MQTFPNISTPYSVPRKISDKYVEDQYLDGTSVARAEFSTYKEKTIPVSWDSLQNSEVSTILAFIDSVRASVFQWTDPSTETDYVVRFVSDPFDYEPLAGFPGYNKATMRIMITDVIADSVDDGLITDAVDTIEDDGYI